jgi:two-component system, NtrC family, sensor kinase
MNWRLKAILPVAATLVAGLLLFLYVTLSFDPSERRPVILVAAGGALAICAVVLAALAVLIQRPLAELEQKIRRLRAGDLDVSVSFAKRRDEIGHLGKDFNEMVRQLRESRREIERLHRTQMSRAEHLATLGELAAGLAHEIRNPLAGIAGVIEIVGRELPAASPSREILGEVQREVRHIQRILSDLLDYSRPRPPDIRPADLNETVRHAVGLARQQVGSRPIQIELAARPELVCVEHDAAGIQQVLLNLLLNALQAIDGEGVVRIEMAADDGFAVLAISDNGRGIAPEHLGNIFRPFFTTKGQQGTGLGLSLARRTVEAHGGRIEVTSRPGEGSRFTVWLPMCRTAPPETSGGAS